ncbi:ribonuclease HII [Clostridiales bacterium PH28_bin88]|nr:ribonuclease HII [Clostridiales bacterium PH28_bin88]
MKASKDIEIERARVDELYCYERDLAVRGFNLVAGMDEAGRGPLAGPVAAAAVILPLGVFIPGLNDSKLIPGVKRELLAEQIKNVCVSWAVAMVHPEDIDRVNILQATLMAMREAVARLTVPPRHLIIDALRVPGLDIPQMSLVGGDRLSASVAAASILAKVARDRVMQEWDAVYPVYGFARHKGYPTPDHLEILKVYGPCPLHRKTFKGVKELLG